MIIEVIGPKDGGDPESGRIAGLAFEVKGIDELAASLKEKGYPIGEPHAALQGGRIVSVHHWVRAACRWRSSTFRSSERHINADDPDGLLGSDGCEIALASAKIRLGTERRKLPVREVVIVEAVRTPMGRRGAHGLSPASTRIPRRNVLNEVVKRAGIESSMVEDVVFGCVDQVGEQGANVARNVLLTADFPYDVPATTVDRQCGSGQQAIHFAANLIQAGTCDITIGGGVESMSRVPMGVNIMQGPGAPFHMPLMEKYPLTPQGISAEEIAKKWGIERARKRTSSRWRATRRPSSARDEGRFDREIAPIDVKLEGLAGDDQDG